MALFQINPCSAAFLLAAVALGLLYHKLSRKKTRSNARIAYNRSILAAVFWMLFDFLEYSAAEPWLAELFLVLTTIFIAVTLCFVLTAGILLANKDPRVVRYVPLAAAVILSPFFEVQASAFTPFDDKFNIPLGIWLGVEFAFFLAFPLFLYSVRRKCSKKKVIERLDSLIRASAFVIVFTMTYYVYHLFVPLPPLTWVMAIAYAGLTYRAFG